MQFSTRFLTRTQFIARQQLQVTHKKEALILILNFKMSEDLKAGHPPAVKAGGMRIKQNTKPHEKPQEMTPEEEEEYGPATSPPKHDVQVMISGALSRGNKDFPPDAVRAFHDKPQPSYQKSPQGKQNHHLNQPRK